MKIILLNGPPSSGKDTAARAIYHTLGWSRYLRMSAPIKEAFAAMMGHELDRFGNIEGMTQTHKETINPTLGCSPRQWQIDFSERFMKQLYGDNIFARIFLHRAAQLAPDTVVIVPDCGFNIELNTLINAGDSPDYPYFTRSDIFLIRLWCKNFTFARDSREYIYSPVRHEIREADLLNEDKDVFEAAVIRQLTSFLKGEP